MVAVFESSTVTVDVAWEVFPMKSCAPVSPEPLPVVNVPGITTFVVSAAWQVPELHGSVGVNTI